VLGKQVKAAVAGSLTKSSLSKKELQEPVGLPKFGENRGSFMQILCK
jgi:hypothetical protein